MKTTRRRCKRNYCCRFCKGGGYQTDDSLFADDKDVVTVYKAFPCCCLGEDVSMKRLMLYLIVIGFILCVTGGLISSSYWHLSRTALPRPTMALCSVVGSPRWKDELVVVVGGTLVKKRNSTACLSTPAELTLYNQNVTLEEDENVSVQKSYFYEVLRNFYYDDNYTISGCTSDPEASNSKFVGGWEYDVLVLHRGASFPMTIRSPSQNRSLGPLYGTDLDLPPVNASNTSSDCQKEDIYSSSGTYSEDSSFTNYADEYHHTTVVDGLPYHPCVIYFQAVYAEGTPSFSSLVKGEASRSLIGLATFFAGLQDMGSRFVNSTLHFYETNETFSFPFIGSYRVNDSTVNEDCFLHQKGTLKPTLLEEGGDEDVYFGVEDSDRGLMLVPYAATWYAMDTGKYLHDSEATAQTIVTSIIWAFCFFTFALCAYYMKMHRFLENSDMWSSALQTTGSSAGGTKGVTRI